MLLRIVAPHYVAGAVFDTTSRRCVRAAPIIKWMIGQGPEQVLQYLKRKGFTWQWLGQP